MKRALAIVAVIVLLLVFATGLLWVQSPVRPEAWTPPPPAPALAAYAKNDRLRDVEWWAKQLVGPEAITLTPQGTLVAGLKDGRIVELAPGSDTPKVLADTKGRPLAVAFQHDGRLYVCDAHKGLLALAPGGTLATLATGEGGIPFRFFEDLDIGRDGIVYCTDASARHSIERFTEDLLEHGTTGRVLAYDPATKQVTRLADGFAFANGITLSPDGTHAIVAEPGSYRLWRVGVKGPDAGKKSLFTDALPGFPDNVRRASAGGYWVAIGSPRKAIVDALAGWPNVRRIVAALPKSLQPKPARHAYVLRVDEQGVPVESLQFDDPASYSPIAGVTESPDGWLYLGSFAREGVARVLIR